MLRSARPLLLPFALHCILAVALWSTGSPHGTWTFECGIGATAWDLTHGRNPAFAWSDTYDSWTSGYLLWAWLEAPLMRLPWDPIFAVKAVALATTGVLGLLAFLFLREVTGRREALLGASAVLLCPPSLWYVALHGGNYHYTELVPSLALFWRLAVWMRAPAWGARGAIELGLLAGLAVATSLGSILPVALAAAVFLRLHPRRLLRPATWLALPAAGLGAAPLLIKAMRQPFGVPPAAEEFELPYLAGAFALPPLHKLLALPARLADHVGFADVDPSLAPADQVLAAALLAVAVLALVDGARGMRRGAAPRLLAALPGLYAAGLLSIYLLLPITMPPRSLLSDFRDVRWLPPALAGAGMALPMLLARLPRRGAWLPLAAVPLVLGLVGQAGLVPWSDVGPRLPYTGRCHFAQGLYAGKVLPPARDGAPLRPELCDGFGDAAARDGCRIGRAASVAVYAWSRGGLGRGARSRGIPAVQEVCAALPPRERRACFRQLGWALANPARDLSAAGLEQRAACGVLATTQDQVWCREGFGFRFADELGGWPERLPAFLVGVSPQGQQATMAGVGARLGMGYRSDADVERACRRYDRAVDGALAPCIEGAASVRPGG